MLDVIVHLLLKRKPSILEKKNLLLSNYYLGNYIEYNVLYRNYKTLKYHKMLKHHKNK